MPLKIALPPSATLIHPADIRIQPAPSGENSSACTTSPTACSPTTLLRSEGDSRMFDPAALTTSQNLPCAFETANSPPEESGTRVRRHLLPSATRIHATDPPTVSASFTQPPPASRRFVATTRSPWFLVPMTELLSDGSSRMFTGVALLTIHCSRTAKALADAREPRSGAKLGSEPYGDASPELGPDPHELPEFRFDARAPPPGLVVELPDASLPVLPRR
mmetsp:Transcript_34145/g.55104  ORF Transcript_34145/g.55104 Transcript_34145/m.55104 type:complete len:220 (+) Transcript_34145:589-1248(+)